MKTFKLFLDETVEFRGTNSPIVILDGRNPLKPTTEELQLLNSKFYGLRVLAVQKTEKAEKQLFIGNQFKETHESIAKRFPKTLSGILPIKVHFETGGVFPLIADSLDSDHKFILTDSIFSAENSPFAGKDVNTKLRLISTILDKWNWLDKLCASYNFQETGGQKRDKENLERVKSNPKFKDYTVESPLSTGLWVTSGILSDIF